MKITLYKNTETRFFLLIWLAALIGACAINFWHVPLFAGALMVFGNIIAVAITLMFGLLPGLAISVLSSLVPFYIWGHALITIPLALEILVIAWAVDRHKSPVHSGMLYWFTAGWVIVAISYMSYGNFLVISQIAIVIKFIFNGLLNVMLGYFLANLHERTRLSLYAQGQTFEHAIRNNVFFAISIAIIVISIVWLQVLQSDRRVEVQSSLQNRSHNISVMMESFIEEHRTALLLSRELLVDDHSHENWAKHILAINDRYPSILTMLMADDQGNIVASAPENLLEMAKSEGLTNVADRPYFYEAKETGQSFVSEAFMGRGFGSDPIIALSVPLFENNVFVGILQASLNLEVMSDKVKELILEEEYLALIDNNNRIIYASPELGYQFLEDISNLPIAAYIEANKVENDQFFLNTENRLAIVPRLSVDNSLGWKVFLALPRTLYEGGIAQFAYMSLVVLILSLVIGFILTRALAAKISAPIRELNEKLSRDYDDDDFGFLDFTSGDKTEIIEIREMQARLNDFAMRLGDSLFEVKAASADKASLNDELVMLNKNLERIVEEKTHELQTALEKEHQANEAKSVFLANMSHEIRTPMNGVLGILHLMESEDLSEGQKRLLKLAETSAKSLLALINDILDFAKVESSELVLERIEFNVRDLLSDIVQLMNTQIGEKDVKLILDVDGLSSDMIASDPNRIRQIFNNLISNAIKFTPKGHVKVTVSSRPDPGDSDGDLVLEAEVKDTGIGMEQHYLPDLFKSFTQADASTTRKFGGTGLGLAICQRLCQIMGGDIAVTSQIDVGTSFKFHIKVWDAEDFDLDAAARGETSMRAVSSASLPTEAKLGHIMVVEDNEINQHVISMMLEDIGHTVALCSNGKDAITRLSAEADQKHFDLIIMDCQMPIMDGYTATQFIRAGKAGDSYNDVPIIALTANAMKGDREKCLAVGMNDYLIKPIDQEALKNTLNNWM